MKAAIKKLSKFTGVVGSPEKILEAAKKKTGCDTESCVYKSEKIREVLTDDEVTDILKEYFKPSGPAFSTEWLSNYNIDDVLDQFQKKYRSFYHVYFQMRDFANKKLNNEEKRDPEMLKYSLNDIDFSKKIKEGVKTFGCVLKCKIFLDTDADLIVSRRSKIDLGYFKLIKYILSVC